jgi:hypothetical protein
MQPWQYYDLGHGLCSYTFFESVSTAWPAPSATSTPRKDSSKAQLLEAKANLQRMVVSIPLADDERAAVDDRQAALDQLLERLADAPTPAGAAPWQLGVRATGTLLSIADVVRARLAARPHP